MNWDRELDDDPSVQETPPPDPPGPSDDDGASPVARSAKQPLNDYGNGQRMVIHFGEDLMFVARLGWFVWTGQVWQQDFDRMLVRKKAHLVPPIILEEAMLRKVSDRDAEVLRAAGAAEGELDRLMLVPAAERTAEQAAEMRRLEGLIDSSKKVKARDSRLRAEHQRFAKSAGNSSKVTNMLVEAEPYVARDIERLNVDPLAVNCASCTLAFERDAGAEQDWESEDGLSRIWKVAPRPHRRADLITKMAPVEYDPEATCPEFDGFLRTIQPDPAMRDFLQRWFGYSLTGLTSEQKLVFFHGTGRNGKSTLVDLVARLFGEYATSVPIESLTGTEQRKGSDATPDLVRAIDARMLRASEPEEGIRFREATVKGYTGGEPLLIRRMREEFVEVTPKFKLTISGNHKPNVRGTDEGIWRRILLVPFAVQIPKAEIDPLLPGRLWAERSGILNWVLAGTLDFLRGGLREPDDVLEATEAFRDESDPIRSFLMECCQVTGDIEDNELARDLIEAVQVWQRDQGGTPWGNRAISLRLSEKADLQDPKLTGTFTRHRSSRDKGYSGIRLSRDMRERLDEVRRTRGERAGGRKDDAEGFV